MNTTLPTKPKQGDKLSKQRVNALRREGFGSQPLPELMDEDELATRWRVDRQTLKYYRKIGLLHPVRLSARLLRYRRAEIEQIERNSDL